MAGGNVGIGTASPTSMLSVGFFFSISSKYDWRIVAATGITSSGTINFFQSHRSQLVATDGSSNLQSLAVATYPSLTETFHMSKA